MSELSELQAWLETISLWKTLLIICIVWVIIGKLIKTLPQVKSAIEIFMNLALLPQMQAKLNSVHHEVFPNSGKSLRDAVDQTKQSVDEVREVVEDHYIEQKEISNKVDEIVESGILPREGMVDDDGAEL